MSFKRLLTAATFGLLLSLASSAYAACNSVCDGLRCLGCAPTGAQVKSFLGVNCTILFEDCTKYNYYCTQTSGNTAVVYFIPAKLDPIATRPWPTFQLPSLIKVKLEVGCDGKLRSILPL